MDAKDKKKIQDFLNSPDTDLLTIIYNQYDTPNADLAKWVLNYRLYDNMVRLNQAIQENSKHSIRYNRYMFWIALFMAGLAFINIALVVSSIVYIN
ncbi:hypothetical protein C0580_04505 [Candidatus Parcubacteria bacterium]|nr:MAG: hypothetical protein C0580_04505 [Candidatus Parcubacteria bacterium]